MKINYDEIIEKAHKRKEALLKLQALAADVPKHVQALRSAHSFCLHLKTKLDAIDSEGQALLGPAYGQLRRFAYANAEHVAQWERGFTGTGYAADANVLYSYTKLLEALATKDQP